MRFLFDSRIGSAGKARKGKSLRIADLGLRNYRLAICPLSVVRFPLQEKHRAWGIEHREKTRKAEKDLEKSLWH